MDKKTGKRWIGWIAVTSVFLMTGLLTAGISLYTLGMMNNRYVADHWQDHVILTDYEDRNNLELS